MIEKYIFHVIVHNLKSLNFWIRRKNVLSFSRYLDFCVLSESLKFKVCDIIIDIASDVYRFFLGRPLGHKEPQ